MNYRAINSANPAEDVAAFVKKSPHVEVTKAQLLDKMKRFKEEVPQYGWARKER